MYPQTYWGKGLIVLTPVTSPSVTQRMSSLPGSTPPPLGLENAFQKPLEGPGFSGGISDTSLAGPAMNLSLLQAHNLCICLHCASGIAGPQLTSWFHRLQLGTITGAALSGGAMRSSGKALCIQEALSAVAGRVTQGRWTGGEMWKSGSGVRSTF